MEWRFGPGVVVDTEIPDKILPALRLVFINLVWILPLVAIERAVEKDFVTAGVLALGLAADLFVAVKWARLGAFRTLGVRPVGLILIGTGVICIIVGAAFLSWPSGRSVTAPPQPQAQTPPASSAPKKAIFYSRADKDRLADMCRELEELLLQNGGDGSGTGVFALTTTLVNDWQILPKTIPAGLPPVVNAETDKIQADLAAANAASAAMHRALYDKDGFRQAYPTYSEELSYLVTDGQTQIQTLQRATNALAEFVQALVAAAKYDDPVLRARIVSSGQIARDSLAGTNFKFQVWESQAVQRIKQFRATLSE